MPLVARESLRMLVPPQAVWPWLVDFHRVAQWNEKLESHDGPEGSEMREGTSFWVTYRWRGRSHHVQATVEELREPERFVIRYHGGDLGRGAWVRETVRITPYRGATLVGREVFMHDPRLPLWARLVMGFIGRFGTPKGESDLQAVRRLMTEAAP